MKSVDGEIASKIIPPMRRQPATWIPQFGDRQAPERSTMALPKAMELAARTYFGLGRGGSTCGFPVLHLAPELVPFGDGGE
jgi:hypothetical protein